jgi:hypothetical protein
VTLQQTAPQPLWRKQVTTAIAGLIPATAIGVTVQGWDADLQKIASASPWTIYVPTAAPTAGTITAYTGAGRYIQLGKTVLFTAIIAISNNGTGSGLLNISVPVTAGISDQYVGGRETAATGKSMGAVIVAGTTAMFTGFYDNSYPGGAGYNLVLSGSYEAA